MNEIIKLIYYYINLYKTSATLTPHLYYVSYLFKYFLELVQLHASSAVKDGSTAYYDPDIATWVLNLTLRIPKLGSTSSSTSKIMFRVDLALPNETELKRNSIFASCRNSSLHFVGDCRERNVHTKYFSQSKDEAEVNHRSTSANKIKLMCLLTSAQ